MNEASQAGMQSLYLFLSFNMQALAEAHPDSPGDPLLQRETPGDNP